MLLVVSRSNTFSVLQMSYFQIYSSVRVLHLPHGPEINSYDLHMPGKKHVYMNYKVWFGLLLKYVKKALESFSQPGRWKMTGMSHDVKISQVA